MSGVEVATAVAGIVAAFQDGSEIITMLKEENKRKMQLNQPNMQPATEHELRARIQQEMAEEQLAEVLSTGAHQVRSKYDSYVQHWSMAFEQGDLLIRHSLGVVLNESEVLCNYIRDARDNIISMPPVVHLQELANRNRFNAQAALDEYHFRLLTAGSYSVPAPPSYTYPTPPHPQALQQSFSGTTFRTANVPQSSHSTFAYPNGGHAISLDGSPATPAFASFVRQDSISPISLTQGHPTWHNSVPLVNQPVPPPRSLGVRSMSAPYAQSQTPGNQYTTGTQPGSSLSYVFQNLSMNDNLKTERKSSYPGLERVPSNSSLATHSTANSTERTTQPQQPRTKFTGPAYLKVSPPTISGGGVAVQGRPCKANGYHGFCKGAWSVQEKFKKAFDVCQRPTARSMYCFEEYFKCKHCKFEGSVDSPDSKNKRPDPKIYIAQCGVEYKWAFLAKCHVSMNKEIHYRCIVCYFEGMRSQLFGDAEGLMHHIALHHKTVSAENQRRTRMVVGREPATNEDYDAAMP